MVVSSWRDEPGDLAQVQTGTSRLYPGDVPGIIADDGLYGLRVSAPDVSEADGVEAEYGIEETKMEHGHRYLQE